MQKSISLNRADEMLRLIFQELKNLGGRARPKDLFEIIEPKLALSDYEKEPTKTGATRWQTHMRFYTNDCRKAGYMQKSGGYWTLNDEGEKALQLPPGQLLRHALKFRAKQNQGGSSDSSDDGLDIEAPKVIRQTIYEQAVEDSGKEIEEHINNVDPYDFQKLVAELLVAMGYFVPYVAEPGPDGGIDVLAYKDPLGTSVPRIKVQVKHRVAKITVKEVRELEGLLRTEGDIGLIVSSGGFTKEANGEIRGSNKRIETIDMDRLIELWQKHYDKITESGKSLLSLVPVFFLAPPEE